MPRIAAALCTSLLAAAAVTQGHQLPGSPLAPRARALAQEASGAPFLWEYAELPYGYPKGGLYTAPDGAFSAKFGATPAVHQLNPMGTPMTLYQGSVQHREGIATNVHVTVAPGLKTDDVSMLRKVVFDSHSSYEKSLNAKRLRTAVRNFTGSQGPMMLEFEVEYKFDDVPVRSIGFWALTPDRMVRAYAQFCPLLNAEEVAIARHFPTTVSIPGVDALSLAQQQSEPSADAQKSDLYRTLEFESGVSLDLPSNWKILSDSTRQTMDASRVAREIEAQGAALDSQLPFAANLYGDAGHVLAMANLRFYAQMPTTQAEIQAMDGETLQALDDALHEESVGQMQRMGQTVTWLGAQRAAIGDLVAVVCSYERVSADPLDHFCVRLVRIHDGPRSFTLTLSHRKSQTALLKPICDHIMRSLRRKPAQSISLPSEAKK